MHDGGHWTRSPRVAGRLAAIGAISPLVWWLGWFPGFIDRDGLAHLQRVDEATFTNAEPLAYSVLLWVARPLGGAATVTFLQATLIVAAVMWAAVTLTRLGLAAPLAGLTGAAILFLPAVATSAISLWSDTVAAAALVVLFTDLVRIGVSAGPPDRMTVVRLGATAAVVWLFRPSELVSIVIVGVVLLAAYRHAPRSLAPAAAIVLVTVAGVSVATWFLPVERTGGRTTDVLTATLAAAHYHSPDSIPGSDIEFMASLAPIDVWIDAYDCHDARLLLDDREFDRGRLQARPAALRGAATRATTHNVGTAMGHRLCAAEYVFLPSEPGGQVFRGPEYTIPYNELGIEREPVVDRLFRITKSVWLKTIQPDRRWLWWRPGLPLLAAAAGFSVLAVRRRRRWALAGWLLAGHTLAVTAVIIGPEFREVFGLYLLSWLGVLVAAGGLRTERDQPDMSSASATSVSTPNPVPPLTM